MRDHTQGEWKQRPSAAPSISHSPEMRPLEAGWGSSTTGGCGGVATMGSMTKINEKLFVMTEMLMVLTVVMVS